VPEELVDALRAILGGGETRGARNRCANEVKARQFLPLVARGPRGLAITADRMEDERIGG
jgi:hypothetical protein